MCGFTLNEGKCQCAASDPAAAEASEEWTALPGAKGHTIELLGLRYGVSSGSMTMNADASERFTKRLQLIAAAGRLLQQRAALVATSAMPMVLSAIPYIHWAPKVMDAWQKAIDGTLRTKGAHTAVTVLRELSRMWPIKKRGPEWAQMLPEDLRNADTLTTVCAARDVLEERGWGWNEDDGTICRRDDNGEVRHGAPYTTRLAS